MKWTTPASISGWGRHSQISRLQRPRPYAGVAGLPYAVTGWGLPPLTVVSEFWGDLLHKNTLYKEDKVAGGSSALAVIFFRINLMRCMHSWMLYAQSHLTITSLWNWEQNEEKMGSELLSQPLNSDLCWPSLCSQPLKEQMTKGQLVARGIPMGYFCSKLNFWNHIKYIWSANIFLVFKKENHLDLPLMVGTL